MDDLVMDDLAPPKLFLDASLILAGLLSDDPASPGKRLFKMGEVRLITLWTSRHTLRETEGALRGVVTQDYERLRAILAESLVVANVITTADPDEATIQMCVGLTEYRPDAYVLAAAVERDCEVLVSYDNKHLLGNPQIGPPNTRLVVMSGGEALEWAIDQVKTRARLRQERQRKPQ